jgi:hypothetical protein
MVRVDVTAQVVSKPHGTERIRNLHIGHTTPQTTNNGLWVPTEDVHNGGPAQTSKGGPGTVLDPCASFWCDERGERVHVWLHGQLGQGEDNSSKDINDNLNMIRIPYSL